MLREQGIVMDNIVRIEAHTFDLQCWFRYIPAKAFKSKIKFIENLMSMWNTDEYWMSSGFKYTREELSDYHIDEYNNVFNKPKLKITLSNGETIEIFFNDEKSMASQYRKIVNAIPNYIVTAWVKGFVTPNRKRIIR